MSEVWHVWTDGSCAYGVAQAARGVLGWGGWCAIVWHSSDGEAHHGRVPDTTNVRMELLAATRGLRAVPDGERAVLHVDCTVVLSVQHWIDGQRRNPQTCSRRDGRYWRELADELERVRPEIDLLGKGTRDPLHKRAHVMAGAEARGGLRGLPADARPLDDGHRIRKGMQRARSKSARAAQLGFFDVERRPPLPRLVHARDCVVGACVSSCPIQQRDGAWPGRERGASVRRPA